VTLRDRLVLTAVAMIAVIGAAWVLVVSPERKKASNLASQVASAKSQLEAAETKLNTARQAQQRYASAYAQIVSLGKAVPTTQEIPSLIYQLSQASRQKSVDFQSIAVGSGTTTSTAASSATATATAASAGFQQVPFTFGFSGSYFSLESMLRQLTDLATLNGKGALEVSGRLLTIQSVKLSPNSSEGKSKGLTASITATAYQLPPEAASAASSTSGTATTSSSAPTTSSPAPAIVKVK
jgi:Tfp pilus assembly protein PilO